MQIKLLHDMPEKIWSALDNRAYLLSTRLFLLARHVNTSLQLDSQHSARVLTRFPVLTTQWAAIGHFKATILQVSYSQSFSLFLTGRIWRGHKNGVVHSSVHLSFSASHLCGFHIISIKLLIGLKWNLPSLCPVNLLHCTVLYSTGPRLFRAK